MLRPSALSLARSARQAKLHQRISCASRGMVGSIGGRFGQPKRFLSSEKSNATGTKRKDDLKVVSSLTLEEVHNMRSGLQRSATIAKKRLEHDEEVKYEQALAGEKEVARLRKNAARAVPHMLGTDMYLFRKVLAALNLTASSAFDENRATGTWMEYNEAEEGGDGFSHYRAIYLDSIPSFAKMLGKDPGSVDRLVELDGLAVYSNSNDSSLGASKKDISCQKEAESIAEQSLDKLAAAGFADLKWAKEHRLMPKQKEQLAKYLKLQHKKEEELKKVQINLVTQIQKLERATKDQRSPGTSANKTVGDDSESNLMKGLFDKMTSFFQPLSPDSENSSEEKQEVNRDLTDRAKRLAKIRKKVEFYEERKLGLTRQLESVQAEIEKFQPTLSGAAYDDANNAARRILSGLCPAFAAHMKMRHAKMIEQYQVLDAQTDLTKPHEWYPRTRLTRRKIIFQGGPTNSGKTYESLQRLKDAEKGLYLAPLRLLAAEVYETLTSQGVYTNLLTGQEKRKVPFSTHSSATIEMAPTDEDFDIVVIDEIQMISDTERGAAWTKALLGIQCKEMHVCGGLEAHDLVKKIAEVCGDEFEFKEYSRFSDLCVADKSISNVSNKAGSYKAVEPGDCVVAFSRNDIFAIKREIEKNTDHKCCVIYGTLPPQTRADQARKFNDPDSGYNILVASDAIGMGLNLNIRRIIFNSMFKSNGQNIVRLDHSSVKQIAGRAGRRNSPFPDGIVTCRDPADMAHLRQCMSTDIAPIRKGGLIPTADHFEMFSAAAEKYDLGGDVRNKLHRVIAQFSEMATLKGDFFMCRKSHLELVAKWMDDLPLSIKDKYVFCMSPVQERCNRSSGLLKNFAKKHAYGEVFGLKNRSFIPKRAKTFEDLSNLCGVHHEVELFLWLNQKFPGNAVERITAEQVKERTIELINQGLAETDRLRLTHNYIRRDQNIRKNWKEQREGSERRDGSEFHDFVHGLDEHDELVEHAEIDDV